MHHNHSGQLAKRGRRLGRRSVAPTPPKIILFKSSRLASRNNTAVRRPGLYSIRAAVGALVCVTHPSCRLKPDVGAYSKSQLAFFATTMNAFEITQSAGARRSAAIPTR